MRQASSQNLEATPFSYLDLKAGSLAGQTLYLQSRTVVDFYSKLSGNEMYHAETRIQALLRYSEIFRDWY